MSGSLRCYSFHSVKGGVGKSALSTMTALAAAAQGAETFLIDMDLTGTSLSDVLDLVAPRFPVLDGELQLLEKPTGWLTDEELLGAVFARQDARDGPVAIGAPFLNDYLLFQTPSWDKELDIERPAALGWKMSGAPENLRVLPSSALPRDLERILPVVYDEERAAFLESRLEYLLGALVPTMGERVLVIDTPPTIPGLSRAVLSLAIRLGRGGKKEPLAEDGSVRGQLRDAGVDWQAFIVSTMDWQDVRAAARWVNLLLDDERDVVRWLLNKAPSADTNREAALRDIVSPQLRRPSLTSPVEASEPLLDATAHETDSLDARLLSNLRWVEVSGALQSMFQRTSAGLDAPARWLEALEGKT